MKGTPAIALLRRKEATAKFIHKIEVLEKLLTDGDYSRFPKRTSVSSFASWEDTDLHVNSISRSIIYDGTAEYAALHQRLEHLLKRIAHARAKVVKKTNIEAELRRRLEDAEDRAQSYVNQYSAAMADLAEARKQIEVLKAGLRRQIVAEAKVSPLRRVPVDNGTVTTAPTRGKE